MKLTFLLCSLFFSLTAFSLECTTNGVPCAQISITEGKSIRVYSENLDGDVIYSCGPLYESVRNITAVKILQVNTSTITISSGKTTVINCIEEN